MFQRMKLVLEELPKNLTAMGESAFWKGGPGIHITKLPPKLTVLSGSCFYDCENVKISEFGSNDGSSALKTIATYALKDAGSGSVGPTVTEIIIYNSVVNIESNALQDYCKGILTKAYFANNEDSYTRTPSEMGLTCDYAFGYTG